MAANHRKRKRGSPTPNAGDIALPIVECGDFFFTTDPLEVSNGTVMHVHGEMAAAVLYIFHPEAITQRGFFGIRDGMVTIAGWHINSFLIAHNVAAVLARL